MRAPESPLECSVVVGVTVLGEGGAEAVSLTD